MLPRYPLSVVGENGEDMPADSTRLEVDRWLATRVARGDLSPRSAQCVRSRLRTFLNICDDLPASSLDRGQLVAWQQTTGTYSAAERAHKVSAVRQFCRWLVDEGILKNDPSAVLVKVRQPKRVPRALSADAARAVLAAARTPRDRAIVGLMLYCGLRAVEIARLDLADWDPTARTMFLRGKSSNERIVPVPTECVALLEQCLADRGMGAGPFIVGRSPRSPKDGRVTAGWVSTHVSRLMTSAGVHRVGDGRSGHALRHTALSDVYEASKDLRLVQRMAGHASLSSTEVYLRVGDLDRLRVAMGGRDYGGAA